VILDPTQKLADAIGNIVVHPNFSFRIISEINILSGLVIRKAPLILNIIASSLLCDIFSCKKILLAMTVIIGLVNDSARAYVIGIYLNDPYHNINPQVAKMTLIKCNIGTGVLNTKLLECIKYGINIHVPIKFCKNAICENGKGVKVISSFAPPVTNLTIPFTVAKQKQAHTFNRAP